MSPRGCLAVIALATSACNVSLVSFESPTETASEPPPVFGEQTYIKASNTNAEDLFGLSVALSADGSTLAVGARGEASGTGDPLDNSAAGAGAVYVFVRTFDTTSWVQEAYLKASDIGAGAFFGSAVALSADGARLVVGAPFEAGAAGAAYVFTRTAAAWSPEATVKAPNARANAEFGTSVAMSADGALIAVGAIGDSSAGTNPADTSQPGAGAVYIFTRTGTAWAEQAYVKAAVTGTDSFGNSVSLTADGAVLAVGAKFEDSCTTDPTDNSCTNAGAAYVFTRTGAAWTQQAYLKATNIEASDSFGTAVRLSADGSTLAVAAADESSKSSGINGDELDRYATASGAVYVFTQAGATWTQQAFIKASNAATNDFFGSSIALSADGSMLAVGAAEEDSAATTIDGDQADNSALNSGAVYRFSRTGATWAQDHYIKPTNTRASADFSIVALSADGATLAVGADGESSGATGINGLQASQSAADAGAVYIFR
jgi:hypothetical protein